MSMNLAGIEPRQSRQSRLVQGRDSILPEVNTRSQELRMIASMRSAQRGDGGAEQLMRTLGVVNKAAQDVQSYANDKFAKDEETNSARGARDEITGQVDPDLMARSAAYKSAVSLGRTSTSWEDARLAFVEDLRGFIEQQDDEHLEVRLSQVSAKVDEFYQNFALDPSTGKPKEFLSTPQAMRYLSEQMGTTRARLMADATARVEQRFKEEARAHFAERIRSQAMSGDPLDITAARAVLPPTVTSDEIGETYVSAVIATATELEAKGRYEDSRRLTNQSLGLSAIPLPEGQPGAPAITGSSPAGAGKTPRVAFQKLAAAVMAQESGGDPNAVSPKGAVGLMQTMPGTLRDPGFGVRPAKDDSPEELARVGRDYLRAMLKRYSGNIVKALAAYNAGPGNVDQWVDRNGKVSDAEFVRLIPFTETRSYVGSVLRRAGVKGYEAATGASDPVVAYPNFRLVPEGLDPVKRADADPRLATVPQLIGALELQPKEREQLLEFRQALGNRISERWAREYRDQQDETAGDFLLRLNGQGTPATSQEISEAARTRRIRPEQAASLFNLMRSNAADAENAQERAVARADRDQAQRQEREVEVIVSSYLGSILSGREAPQAARDRLLREASSIRDPKVRRTVIEQVGGLANTVESVRNNSAPVRRVLGKIDDLEGRQRDRLSTIIGGRRQLVATRMSAEFDVSRSRIARAVAEGEDPERAYAAEQARLGALWGTLSSPHPAHSN